MVSSTSFLSASLLCPCAACSADKVIYRYVLTLVVVLVSVLGRESEPGRLGQLGK